MMENLNYFGSMKVFRLHRFVIQRIHYTFLLNFVSEEQNFVQMNYSKCELQFLQNKCYIQFCHFDISVGVGAFVIGLSQVSSFFSYK